MCYGVDSKFNAKLRKKRDGAIVYHDNRLINFVFRILLTGRIFVKRGGVE